jgi:LysR family transcriptional regulator, flagellar master operon regulator
MNIEELQTFIAIVETKSLVAASRRLHVTQSTVTARMNSLEQKIGQRLLHRSKAGAELTSPGFKFLRHAELMLQLWSSARHQISLPAGFNAICNIGLDFDLWTDLGERFVEYLKRDERRIAASVWPAEQMQLNRWLRMGLIDVAFCFSPQAADNFSNRIIMDDEIIMVSSLSSSDNSLGPSYVYVDHGDDFRRRHAEAFPNYSAGLVVASSQWALDTMLRRGGSGYLPRRVADASLKEGRLFAVSKAPSFKRRVYLAENLSAIRHWAWYQDVVTQTFESTSSAMR